MLSTLIDISGCFSVMLMTYTLHQPANARPPGNFLLRTARTHLPWTFRHDNGLERSRHLRCHFPLVNLGVTQEPRGKGGRCKLSEVVQIQRNNSRVKYLIDIWCIIT